MAFSWPFFITKLRILFFLTSTEEGSFNFLIFTLQKAASLATRIETYNRLFYLKIKALADPTTQETFSQILKTLDLENHLRSTKLAEIPEIVNAGFLTKYKEYLIEKNKISEVATSWDTGFMLKGLLFVAAGLIIISAAYFLYQNYSIASVVQRGLQTSTEAAEQLEALNARVADLTAAIARLNTVVNNINSHMPSEVLAKYATDIAPTKACAKATLEAVQRLYGEMVNVKLLAENAAGSLFNGSVTHPGTSATELLRPLSTYTKKLLQQGIDTVVL